MDQSGSLWTVEEACRNAYPARELILDGWLLRAAGGRARRTNSVNPLRGGPRDPSSIVAHAEAVYASLGQAALFRVPDFLTEMDAALDRLGYDASAANRTLWADGCARADVTDVTLRAEPDADWYRAWEILNLGVSPADVAAFRASVEAVILPAAFVTRWAAGQPAAVAYGVIHRGILVLEAVVTDARRRREGHGRTILSALGDWAGRAGALSACLQVSADNAPALALYRNAGFSRDLYGYRYRSAPKLR